MQAALFFVLLASFFGSPEKSSCTATGDLEIVHFESKVFPAQRNLRILLPAGYRLPENRHRRYPVLYLNDGQNLFDVCTAQFTGEEWSQLRRMEVVQAMLAAETSARLTMVERLQAILGSNLSVGRHSARSERLICEPCGV